MSFTSVTGHLMELEFNDRYHKWHSCDPVDLYHAPIKKYVPQDKLDIQKTLEEEARKCQWLILWLDCDREGENIAFEVVEICMRANRNLNIWRARFSAMTDRDIYDAVTRLSPPNQLQAEAVDLRQEIDLRIGASFTRFQTMLLRDAFILDSTTNETNVVLSYGPCQSYDCGFRLIPNAESHVSQVVQMVASVVEQTSPLIRCRLWCKGSKDIQYGVLMLSGYWILKRVSGEILVVADMMTKPTHPFTRQNFQLESLDGVRITMFVPFFDRFILSFHL